MYTYTQTPQTNKQTKQNIVAKLIFNNKRNSGVINILKFKLYIESRAVKASCYWLKIQHIDQWNRPMTRHKSTYPCTLVFDEDFINTQWSKESIFNKWQSNKMTVGRRIQVDPYMSLWRKLNSKWIKDLNIKSDTLNLKKRKKN